MKANRSIYYILGTFIAVTFLLIYIQFNSSKNINKLISANERMVKEFNVSAELNELGNRILSIESSVRGIVATADSSYIKGLDERINEVRQGVDKLQHLTDDSSSIVMIDQLDSLVLRKIRFNQQILDSFNLSGKPAAERLLATNYGKLLTDSITDLSIKIDHIRKNQLTISTASIDQSGRKALQFSTALILFVLISSAVLFWYIINIISKQGSLIDQISISERKVKESAELKEKFMANMSHEIRTPMNAILGFTNLLQRKKIDSEAKEFVQIIQRSGENLLALINDILDLSKIEAGMMRIESVPFSLRGLVHSIETMFKAKTEEKQLNFSVTVDEALPDRLEGDTTRLTQILVNLIDNAIKFTSKGSITINITHEGLDGTKVRTGITVQDSGIGIAPEKLDTIFERFQQAEDSVTRRYGGSGLGLSIVKNLVLIQQGSISVKSEIGTGTTFEVILPYEVVSEQEAFPVSSTISTVKQDVFEQVCVLVVEDNEVNQSLIRYLLKSWHLSFDLVSNGRKAVEALQTKTYNLILMDIQMPEMDGYTATLEIRRTLKIDTPIIAMTAHALAGEREKCLSYGMSEYISKPIKEEQLYQLITRFISISPTAVPVSLAPASIRTPAYNYIKLQYMQDVSRGNVEYEKSVTEQFIEVIPLNLVELKKYWDDQKITALRQLAHDMKTTVSIMGLNDQLQPYLDTLEYDDLTEASFMRNFTSVQVICTAAVEEAKTFLLSL